MVDLVVEHVKDSVGTDPKLIPLLQRGLKAKRIEITNTHASQILYVSFDKKKTYRTIPATAGANQLLIEVGGDNWIKIKKDHVYAYASGASTSFECIMLIEQRYSSETE